MTPQLIAASAKLKIGLKNIKLSPPINGIQPGRLNSKKRKIEHIDKLFRITNQCIHVLSVQKVATSDKVL